MEKLFEDFNRIIPESQRALVVFTVVLIFSIAWLQKWWRENFGEYRRLEIEEKKLAIEKLRIEVNAVRPPVSGTTTSSKIRETVEEIEAPNHWKSNPLTWKSLLPSFAKGYKYVDVDNRALYIWIAMSYYVAFAAWMFYETRLDFFGPATFLLSTLLLFEVIGYVYFREMSTVIRGNYVRTAASIGAIALGFQFLMLSALQLFARIYDLFIA